MNTAPPYTLHLINNAGLFQDIGAITPQLVDNDPIALWQDQSGNGVNLTQSTLSQMFRYHPSRDTIELEIPSNSNPPNVLQETMSNSGFSLNRQASSFFMILEPASLRGIFDGTSVQAYTLAATIHSSGNWNLGWAANDGETGPGLLQVYDGTTFQRGSSYVPTSRCLIGCIMGTGGATLVVNGTSTSISALASGSATGLFLSYGATGDYDYAGSIVELFAYNHALSTTELLTLQSYAQSRGCVFSSSSVVCFDGDSITAGVNSTYNQSWPRQLGLSSSPLQYNCAQAGVTMATLESNAAHVSTRSSKAGR